MTAISSSTRPRKNNPSQVCRKTSKDPEGFPLRDFVKTFGVCLEIMFKPIEVKALKNYHLHVKFSDGVEGEVDLSEFVGKGVFKLWDDYGKFESVTIGSSGEIVWNDQVDMDSVNMYLKITGKKVEEVSPPLK